MFKKIKEISKQRSKLSSDIYKESIKISRYCRDNNVETFLCITKNDLGCTTIDGKAKDRHVASGLLMEIAIKMLID